MGLAQGREVDTDLVELLATSEDVIVVLDVGLFGGWIVSAAPRPGILGSSLAARPRAKREHCRAGCEDGPGSKFLEKCRLHGECSRPLRPAPAPHRSSTH